MTADNAEYVCSDAGKRDRFSWLGDRLHSARAAMAVSASQHNVVGPADQALSRQRTSGQILINTLFSPLDMESIQIRTGNVDPLIVDYEFDTIQYLHDYWMRTGNDTFVEAHYTAMTAVVAYASTRALSTETQLYGQYQGKLGIPVIGEKSQPVSPAHTVSMILAWERMADFADFADFMRDARAASAYRVQARLSRDAIDRLLWNHTGAYWEYVSGDGAHSGLGLFDAGSHFWGAYPTAFLTDWVLGVKPTTPGYKTFSFRPMKGFRCEWVHGRVPTPAGNISAGWGYENGKGKFALELAPPLGLVGTVIVPFEGSFSVNGGAEARSGLVTVKGGEAVRVCQL